MNYRVIQFCELIKNVIHPDEECKLTGEIDWTYMVQLAKEHNLLAIFMEEAIKYSSYTMRVESEKEMNEALAIIAGQMNRTNAFLKIYKAFNEAELYPIVMKGLICRQLYGRLGDQRPSGDEDILISPDQYENIKKILVANGYEIQIESDTKEALEKLQEVSFVHPTEKMHIEVHLNPMGKENDARSCMSDYFKNVFENCRYVEIDGIKVCTMNHQEHLIFLIFHALRHFTGSGFGIRQVLDILLYEEKYGSEIDLVQLRKILRDFNADVFMSDLIHIGNSYFGFDIPVWEKPNCPEELLEDMIQRGVFGNKTPEEAIAGNTIMLTTGNYLKEKSSQSIIMIWKSIFPNKIYMLEQAPYLQNRAWLLPVAWIRRWINFAKKNKKKDGALVTKSMEISRKRIKLLKKYDLV